MPDQQRDLFLAYTDFHRIYKVVLNRILSPHGLSIALWGVLKRICYSEPLSLKELTRLHGVEAPTTTASVKKLLGLELVTLIPGEDKREKILSSTDRGCEVFKRVQPVLDQLYAEILGDAETDDIKASIRLFAMLKENILILRQKGRSDWM
jgi:Transcriptional regulators